MKKIIVIIMLVASVFVPLQNAMSDKNINSDKNVVTMLDFDDDDLPLFINF